MKKITAFCVLAEPDKLQYPYIESIRSVSHFANKIIINFAAAGEENPHLRQFEKESHDNLLKLKEEVSDNCKIIIKYDQNWKLQKDQSYEEVRSIIQSALEDCSDGWFLKFDADNIFRKNCKEKIKDLFTEDVDYLIFRRINVTRRDLVGINYSSEDIYAINISNFKKKNLPIEIDGIHNWCRPKIDKTRAVSKIISDVDLIPWNYDATFFTRERVVDFWKKTEEAYSKAENRENRYKNLSDIEVIENYKKYRNLKAGFIITNKFSHPEDILEKINAINSSHWGYNNFKE